MFKVVIGLEVHCELDTKSKNFSASPNKFSMIPNESVSTVDLGLPGILPVPNKEAVRKALLTAMALHCKNPDEVIFDRKNYFYPDLPKGYQITQVTKPMGKDGYLDILVKGTPKRVYIHQLHLEEDTASLKHDTKFSLIDYNRSGVPLIEIVTEPCIESADEAVTFLEDLKDVFLFLGVSEAKSNYGQMRCDVNISLMEEGSDKLGTKVEMKNINAFTSVRDAIEYEIKRQSEILLKGEKVIQETRRIAEDGKTYSMREKVDAVDYKYFLEPNIPSTPLSDEYLYELRSTLPELKTDRFLRYMKEYSLSEYDAKVLSKERPTADYFEEVLSYGSDVELTVNFLTSAILSTLNKLEITLDELFITPKMLSGVVDYVHEGKISLDHGKKILYQAIEQKTESFYCEMENLKMMINEIKEKNDEKNDHLSPSSHSPFPKFNPIPTEFQFNEYCSSPNDCSSRNSFENTHQNQSTYTRYIPKITEDESDDFPRYSTRFPDYQPEPKQTVSNGYQKNPQHQQEKLYGYSKPPPNIIPNTINFNYSTKIPTYQKKDSTVVKFDSLTIQTAKIMKSSQIIEKYLDPMVKLSGHNQGAPMIDMKKNKTFLELFNSMQGCNNFILLFYLNTGEIFGSYHSVHPTIQGETVKDPKHFVFTLSNSYNEPMRRYNWLKKDENVLTISDEEIIISGLGSFGCKRSGYVYSSTVPMNLSYDNTPVVGRKVFTDQIYPKKFTWKDIQLITLV